MSDTMVCPRCGGTMQTFERAGVQVDQCQSCRGIFLDRGELEQLINAEQSHYPQGASQPGYPPPQPAGYPPPQAAGYPPPAYYDEHHDDHHDEHHGHHDDEHHGYQRRGLFHNLFED